MYYQRIELVNEKELEHKVDGSETTVEVLRQVFEPDKQTEECLWLACVNAKGYVVGLHEVSRGGLQQSVANPREIYKRALVSNAAAIIIAHNHPSGDPTPSPSDIEITKRIEEAGDIIGIRLLDHIIIAGGSWYSFKAHNVF